MYELDDSFLLPVRNGRSSVRVLSTPSAKAIVDSFLMLFSRNCMQEGHALGVYNDV